jgi:XTP/dITP diphosphohydrolase
LDLWIASHNSGKIKEFQNLLGEFPHIKVRSAGEISAYSAPAETGATFLENARIKAKSLRSVRNQDWILADDSGLEVEGLGGLPGIHSARYAGPKARDSENIAKLMKMMQIRNVSNRNAQFKASLVIYTPAGEEWTFEGLLKGTISQKVAGLFGFGYDPIFIPDGQTKTLAELDPGYKNRHSHRALAFKEFLAKFKSLES